ncbi:hypothetical protein [Kordiimonas gwangyangensis]|uniref:hypothetical protein n=1 Tax=Kordiimonas gwangyangensis TaxID=288022 RepID=UPI0006872069|nr:hypothetical protein [Kordiimonas gwangyangensis]
MKITRNFKRTFIALAASTALMSTAPQPASYAFAEDTPNIEWDLTDLYASAEAWELNASVCWKK